MGTDSWFCRTTLQKSKDAKCPRCKARYTIGPIFDHDLRRCIGCNAELTEWNLMDADQYIYIIDVERAPISVKALIDTLKTLPEPEALEELTVFTQFLAVNVIKKSV